MVFHLSKESTKEEVILFLKENDFEESVIDIFESKLCWASESVTETCVILPKGTDRPAIMSSS